MCMCSKIIRLGLKFLTVAKLDLIRFDQMAVDLTRKFRLSQQGPQMRRSTKRNTI